MFDSSRLLRPVLFLHISAGEITWFRWRWPIIWLAAVITYLYFYPVETIEKKIEIIDGIIGSCTDILMILPGFYIAALAAIATFRAETMDIPLDGDSAKLKSREQGELAKRILTRRRFLCFLFGYLSFLSLLLALLGAILKWAHPRLFFAELFPQCYQYVVHLLFSTLFGLFFMQLISLTMLGLFYLTDRIHWKKPEYHS